MFRNYLKLNKITRILLVSHDAGGANILSVLADKYQNNCHWATCLSGPAINIFSTGEVGLFAKGYDAPTSSEKISIYQQIHKILSDFSPDLVLTGTSYPPLLETDFISVAREENIKTASYIDHWVNYRERFGSSSEWFDNLPYTIFVGDNDAYHIAIENGFPIERVIEIENPYLDKIRECPAKFSSFKSYEQQNKGLCLLYVSDPISKNALEQYGNEKYWGYTEYDVLNDLMDVTISNKRIAELRIRLHPLEDDSKYSHILNRTREAFNITNIYVAPRNNSLVEDCVWSDIVIGSETMALVIALIIGKKVISYIPIESGKAGAHLPQKQIIRINNKEKLFAELESLYRK